MKYFDYASSTPVNQEVLDAYEKVLDKYFVNSDILYLLIYLNKKIIIK